MSDEENSNEQAQDTTPEIPEDRPVFNPEMIQENAHEPDIRTPEDDLSNHSIKNDAE